IRIHARPIAKDLSVAMSDEDVAADVAAVAYGVGGLEVPHSRFEAELARGQRAGRTDVRHARGHPVIQRRAGENADLGRCAAFEEGELVRLGDFGAETDASRAVDAAIHVLDDVRPDRGAIHAGIGALEFAVARLDRSVIERVVLQRTLTGLVADWAVERMINE